MYSKVKSINNNKMKPKYTSKYANRFETLTFDDINEEMLNDKQFIKEYSDHFANKVIEQMMNEPFDPVKYANNGDDSFSSCSTGSINTSDSDSDSDISYTDDSSNDDSSDDDSGSEDSSIEKYKTKNTSKKITKPTENNIKPKKKSQEKPVKTKKNSVSQKEQVSKTKKTVKQTETKVSKSKKSTEQQNEEIIKENVQDDGSGEWIIASKKQKKKQEPIKPTKPAKLTKSTKINSIVEKKPMNIEVNNNCEPQNNNTLNKNIEIINNANETIDPKIYKFHNTWNIWTHETESKDWSDMSYKIAYTITNMHDFWTFFNGVNKLNQWKYNFFVMKSDSHPTWEHETNRNGGTCSIRVDISNSMDILEQLLILLMNETLTEEIDDINGISFTAKGNWCIIKVWNKNNKNNISTQIPSYLRKIYPSISIKYKENIPEY